MTAVVEPTPHIDGVSIRRCKCSGCVAALREQWRVHAEARRRRQGMKPRTSHPRPRPVREFPLDPLLALVVSEGHEEGFTAMRQSSDDERCTAVQRLAALIGCSTRHVHRLKHVGLTEEEADRAATFVGLHPCELWPEWCDV